MAKKKSNKKHSFKYAQPTGAVTLPSVGPAPTMATATAPSSVRPAAQSGLIERDFSYVSHDLRRVAVLAGSLLALELIIWILFGHTALGNWVDGLVQV